MEQVDLEATVRVAQVCAAAGVPLILPSTTGVDGTQSEVVDEECAEAKLQPQSPYAKSKLEVEKSLAVLGAEKGLRFVTFRFGTIFGVSPGIRFHTAVNKFVWQACQGLPLMVWRSALDQKRPYLDVSDAVRAITFIMERRLFDNRVYNVLTLNATVRDIVEAIRVHVPDLRVELVDSRLMNQLSYVACADRFRTQGFEFRGDLRTGIADTVRMLRNLAGRHITIRI